MPGLSAVLRMRCNVIPALLWIYAGPAGLHDRHLGRRCDTLYVWSHGVRARSSGAEVTLSQADPYRRLLKLTACRWRPPSIGGTRALRHGSSAAQLCRSCVDHS